MPSPATPRKARSSASEAAREAPHRRSRKADTPAEREARKTYRAAAISAALRKRSQPPVCDHTLARSIQYRKGNDNDGRFVGICGVDGCTRVQYLSAPLTKAELDALHAQRPGARIESPPAQHSALTDMTNLPIVWHVLAYLTDKQAPTRFSLDQRKLRPLRDELLGWCGDLTMADPIAFCTKSKPEWTFIYVKHACWEMVDLQPDDILIWTRAGVDNLPNLAHYAPITEGPEWVWFWVGEIAAVVPASSSV